MESNAIALAGWCYQILNDEEQKEHLIEGGLKTAAGYSVASYVNNIEAVYERLVE